MTVGSIVKINDNTEWNGLYGIIDYLHEDIAHVFCVTRPCWLYNCNVNNLQEIKK